MAAPNVAEFFDRFLDHANNTRPFNDFWAAYLRAKEKAKQLVQGSMNEKEFQDAKLAALKEIAKYERELKSRLLSLFTDFLMVMIAERVDEEISK